MSREAKIEELIAQCRSGSVPQRCASIVDLQEMGAKEAVPVILELLESHDHDVQANAAYALGELANKNVGADLLKLLDDPNVLVRVNAVEALGLLEYTEGLPRIIHTLRNDIDPLVRLQAAETLGMLGNVKALSALLEALNDSDSGVRAYAADSIGRLKAIEALPILDKKKDVEQSLFTKAYLLSAMYQLGDKNALTALFDLAGIADETLSVTILNLVVDLAMPRDINEIKDQMSNISQSRPSLQFEVVSLMKRLDSVPDA